MAAAPPYRILHLLPKLDTGGAERVVVEICQGLTAAGHKGFIAAEPGALNHAALRAGAQILPMWMATKSPLAMRRNAKRLTKIISDQKIDLLHAHSRAPAWSGLWAARRTGIPFVTTWHGTYSENLPLKRRYNAVMAAGDRVIAVSHFIADLITARHGETTKLRIIPGGVDIEKFDPGAVLGDRMGKLARDWRLPAGAPVILLPARLTSWKGQSVLIAALAASRHTDAVAVLLGADQGREKYTRQLIAEAEALGVANRLRIAGHCEDMPAALMLADIVVNASTEPEAFGRTIIEAQAMGRMVIATGHGGARETIRPGETGFLVPPGNATALAAAIDEVLDFTAPARIGWGANVREAVAAEYSIAAMQAAVLAVYAELL
jgi:glycosyltransferase involved in cell wall biosynthesis